jgi:hypothetical protein
MLDGIVLKIVCLRQYKVAWICSSFTYNVKQGMETTQNFSLLFYFAGITRRPYGTEIRKTDEICI